MAKMSLEQLKKLREEQKLKINQRDTENKNIEIIVGMGTCGIAAGAKEVLNTLLGESFSRKMETIAIKQTGCIGLCHSEPIVEVKMAGMPDTLYGNVDSKVAKRIIEEHILNKKLIDNHILHHPSADILKGRR